MGFDLGTLMTLGQGGPIPTQMFLNPATMMNQPGSTATH
jgi:hypothetical protein